MFTFGIVNITGSLLGCYPSFGSFVRSRYAIAAKTNSQYF
jgi:MFS superfamily sulfate permease-like transporter